MGMDAIVQIKDSVDAWLKRCIMNSRVKEGKIELNRFGEDLGDFLKGFVIARVFVLGDINPKIICMGIGSVIGQWGVDEVRLGITYVFLC